VNLKKKPKVFLYRIDRSGSNFWGASGPQYESNGNEPKGITGSIDLVAIPLGNGDEITRTKSAEQFETKKVPYWIDRSGSNTLGNGASNNMNQNELFKSILLDRLVAISGKTRNTRTND
jgi:hypothetical protein